MNSRAISPSRGVIVALGLGWNEGKDLGLVPKVSPAPSA